MGLFTTVTNLLLLILDDITGWQDSVMKELEYKHDHERDIFVDMLQEKESEDLKEEARSMSNDERNERLNKLSEKRDELDFDTKGMYQSFIQSRVLNY